MKILKGSRLRGGGGGGRNLFLWNLKEEGDLNRRSLISRGHNLDGSLFFLLDNYIIITLPSMLLFIRHLILIICSCRQKII